MPHKSNSHHRTTIPVWFIVLLLPVFYFNIHNCFDWGDDYAQYLLQAKHIATGVLQSEVAMPGIEVYSPACRPGGFPLFLSPFYFLFNESASGYMYLMSALLFGLGLVYFLFLRSYASSLIAALLVIVFIYNPHTLYLKAEVLAEIPLTLCIVATLFLSHHHKKWVTLLLIFIAMLLKYAGVVLWMAFVLYELKKLLFKKKDNHKRRADYFYMLYLILIPAVYVLVNHVFLKIPLANETWYQSLFFNNEIIDTIRSNSVYYYHVFSAMFEQEVPDWYNAVLKISMTLFLLTGIISKWRERVGAGDLFFVIYFVMILAYPYSKGGYRFIFPLVPIVLVYLYYGMNFYFKLIKGFSVFPSTVFLLFVLLSYTINIRLIQNKNCTTVSGPHEKDFKEAVAYCKSVVKADDAMMFARPWAFKYFSGINSTPVINEWTVGEFNNHINYYKVKYVLASKGKKHELYQQGLQEYLLTCDSCKELWKNETYKLYAISL